MLTKRLLLLPLVLLTACKPPTPAERMESILSWLGTAGMVGDAWLRHATPDTYSRQTLELSGETLRQISSDLRRSPPPAIDGPALDSVLTSSRRRIARMAALIRAKDAPNFAHTLDSLRIDQRMVKAFADSIKSRL
jgi:hypothetical protein